MISVGDSSPNLPLAARITRAWCQRHGVPHHSAPYLDALVIAERFMRDAWSKDAVLALVELGGESHG